MNRSERIDSVFEIAGRGRASMASDCSLYRSAMSVALEAFSSLAANTDGIDTCAGM